jgi:flagellar operon protein
MAAPVQRVGDVPGTTAPSGAPAGRTRPGAGGRSFAAVLAEQGRAQQALHFSAHALDRVRRRDISMDAATLARLESGTARVAAKGGREALILVDDTAYVVSVRNSTVITAVGRDQMKDQVFTNIDSAAIA